jgi:SAM-dependent methyltransferase
MDSPLKSEVELDNMGVFASGKMLDEYSGLSGKNAAFLKALFPIEERVVLQHFPPPPAQVLDLGCGAGRTSCPLAQRGYSVVAGDISPEMIARARQLHPHIDFRVLDAVALDLPSDTFDVVLFSFNGLDYVYPFANRLRALREIFRVLRPGELFVYSSHNLLGHFARIRRPFVRCAYYQLRFIYHSLSSPLFQNYWREKVGRGWLTTYYGIPFRQIRTLREVGFEFHSLESEGGEGLWPITLKDAWPHYVARRPRE